MDNCKCLHVDAAHENGYCVVCRQLGRVNRCSNYIDGIEDGWVFMTGEREGMAPPDHLDESFEAVRQRDFGAIMGSFEPRFDPRYSEWTANPELEPVDEVETLMSRGVPVEEIDELELKRKDKTKRLTAAVASLLEDEVLPEGAIPTHSVTVIAYEMEDGESYRAVVTGGLGKRSEFHGHMVGAILDIYVSWDQ